MSSLCRQKSVVQAFGRSLKLFCRPRQSLLSTAARRPRAVSVEDWNNTRSVPSVLSDDSDVWAAAAAYDPSLYEDDLGYGTNGTNAPPSLPHDWNTLPPEYDEEEETPVTNRGGPRASRAPALAREEKKPPPIPLVVSRTAETKAQQSSDAMNEPEAFSVIESKDEKAASPSYVTTEPNDAAMFPDILSPLPPEGILRQDLNPSLPPPPSSPPPPLEGSPEPKTVRKPPSSPTFPPLASDGSLDDNARPWPSTTGGPTTDTVELIRDVQLPALERAVWELAGYDPDSNDQPPFNVNSPTQVSKALFGVPGKSTARSVLEGMAAAGSSLADAILQYRATKAALKRAVRKAAKQSQGTHVSSVTTVQRSAPVNGTPTTENASYDNDSDPLLLMDASSYIFRAYYSMPPMHRSDGMPTGAVLGFCNMLNRLVLHRLINGEQPRLVLAFDAKGPSFRKELYPEYKANRAAAPVDLVPQFDLIRQAAAAYGLPIVEKTSFEADDVIATLARLAHEEGLDVHILSGDKDLMQLITEPHVFPCIHMIDPMSMSRVAHEQVFEKWGVHPKQLGDVLALAGDSADNVPGVPGIGPKTASALLQEYDTLDNLLDNAANIKQKMRREKLVEFADMARLSRALVALEDDVPGLAKTVGDIPTLRAEPLDVERIEAFFDEMGFPDLKRRFQNQLKRGAPRKRPQRKTYKKVEIPQPEDFADVPF